MQPTDVRYSLRKAFDTAGLPMILFHDLRHTCGTLMIEAGADPSTVSTQLGHSTVGFTLSTYVHPDLSSQERAAAQRFRHGREGREKLPSGRIGMDE